MSTDARAMARRLLAQTAEVSPQPAPTAPTAPGEGPRPGADQRPGAGASPRRRRLEDLPRVADALARDDFMHGELARYDLKSPYYRAHEGFNGATIQLDGREYINYSGYNYLGLASHPRMIEAAKASIDRFGTTCGASRIVSGNIPLHEELERRLAAVHHAEDATLVGSGFLANASVIAFVLGEGDLAVCDELVHNSIVSGTLWSQSRRMQFRHNDPDSLDAVLRRARNHFDNVLVILEGVYSMDGDVCRLPELLEVARRHDCLTMVDEAHSLGVLGRSGHGTREEFDLPGDAVDIWMGTLSKSLASHGGYIAGSHRFVQACRMAAPGMSLYAAGMLPPATAAALTALELAEAEPWRREQLHRNAAHLLRRFRDAGYDCGPASGTPIVPVIIGSTQDTMKAALWLAQEGINANPILYPAVPEGQGRIRFFVTADHTREQLDRTVDTLVSVAPATTTHPAGT